MANVDLEEDEWFSSPEDSGSDSDDEGYYVDLACSEEAVGKSNIVVAWLQAACDTCPERTLLQLVRGEPGLFPPFLRVKEASHSIQDHLELRNNDEVFVRDACQAEDKAHETSRVTQLGAFRACPFQQGFASEGMLCNEPPIPLRVLDFSEAQDLVNLSLVCKSMHQAAHLLFHREEAVAAQLHPSQKLLDPSFQAKALQGIRLGSLMQGTPEAIPIGGRATRFLRSYATADACPARVTWVLHNHVLEHDALTWATHLLQVEGGDEDDDYICLEHAENIANADDIANVDTIVTQTAHLGNVLAHLARARLAHKKFLRVPGGVMDTVVEIESLVAAALREGEHILLRIDHTYTNAV